MLISAIDLHTLNCMPFKLLFNAELHRESIFETHYSQSLNPLVVLCEQFLDVQYQHNFSFARHGYACHALGAESIQ